MTRPPLPDAPIFGPPTLTVATFVQVLVTAHSPALAEADGAAYYQAIQAAGINPAVALAIFAHESQCGTAGVVAAAGAKNWGNLRPRPDEQARVSGTVQTSAGAFRAYRFWLDGLHDWCDHMRRFYAGQTVRPALATYAPARDGNDPGHYADVVVARLAEWAADTNAAAGGTPVRPVVSRQWRADNAHYTIGRPLHEGGGNHGPQAPILYVCLHNTETSGVDDAPSLGWLTTQSDQASAHRLISRSGIRYDLIDYVDTAWHVGRAAHDGYDGWNLNLRSVGLELENGSNSRIGRHEPYGAAQLNTLAHQIASILFSYGRTWEQAVFRHGDVALPAGRRVDPSYLDLASVQAHTAAWLTWFGTLPQTEHPTWIF